MAAPATLSDAVDRLSEASGYKFRISDDVVPGTQLYVVYTESHDFPDRYDVRVGGLGFRVPANLPDASPEDCFFIAPTTIKLSAPDPVRNSVDLNRAAVQPNYVPKDVLGGGPVLVFSWHLWDKPNTPWRPRTHTLVDHYAGCLMRFEQPEHG